ncbi:MAG: hypothetical protein EAZ08_11135 [Cytophagales bacterium]|nr:MAG: hypothetical protein EAZ08_11135 [Cytophagales bacterium]
MWFGYYKFQLSFFIIKILSGRIGFMYRKGKSQVVAFFHIVNRGFPLFFGIRILNVSPLPYVLFTDSSPLLASTKYFSLLQKNEIFNLFSYNFNGQYLKMRNRPSIKYK